MFHPILFVIVATKLDTDIVIFEFMVPEIIKYEFLIITIIAASVSEQPINNGKGICVFWTTLSKTNVSPLRIIIC